VFHKYLLVQYIYNNYSLTFYSFIYYFVAVDTGPANENPAASVSSDTDVSTVSTQEKLEEAQKKLCAMQEKMELMQKQLQRLKCEKRELVKRQAKRIASIQKLLTDDQRRVLSRRNTKGSTRNGTAAQDRAMQLCFMGLLDLTRR